MKEKMKIHRSKKALSPVVASIILIAVTVAVSIAVAAWMGALTFTFMGTEEIKVTSARFAGSAGSKTIIVSVINTGTSPVTLSEAWVNGVQQSGVTYSITGGTVPANSAMNVTITYEWALGANYNIQLKSTKGNTFPYTASAPSS
jgi:flagellin-like protein